MTRRSVAYQKFFAELKRRRVFNSAALYGGVAFVVFQAADFVLPALHLSESVATAIVWISIIGFPFAMAAAWFIDLTSGGLKLTTPPKAGELESIVAQPALRRWPVGIAALAGVALLVAGVGWHFSGKVASGTLAPLRPVPTIGSVAVLPFLDMTQGEDHSYFSEGVAAELLEALGRVPGLEVTARTSAFSFAGSAVDLASVARELKVASILDGSVGSEGDTVELAIHLTAAGGGEDAWSGVFRLPKDSFLSALDEVAWTVAAQFGVDVPAEGAPLLVVARTENFRAYSDYLQGRHYSYEGTPEAFELAIDSYSRSLLLDPEFAPAWTALASAYVQLPEHGGPPMMEILPYVEAALGRAMRPGMERGEGYAVSGYLKWAYFWDYAGAEEDFRKALELNDDNPAAHYWYAQYLATQRRWEEGLAQADLALALDPLSPTAHWTRGLVLHCAGLEGASASFLRALELAPDMYVAAYVLAGHLAMEGDLEGAAKEFDLFSSLTGTDPSAFRAYLAALFDPSKRPEAVAAFQGSGFLGPVQGADLLADLGESDAVLNLLEQAARSHSPYLPWMNAIPQLEGLRSNSRFQAILAWAGF